MTDIDALIEKVRLTFYPRWDRKREWKIEVVRGNHRALYFCVHGKCLCDKKRIFLNESIVNEHGAESEEAEALIIHEIAHAVTNGGHGAVWQRRIEKVITAAEAMGRQSLADHFKGELESYRGAPKVSLRAEVYSMIEDAVYVDRVSAGFGSLMKCLSREVAMYPGEILQKCPRCREVFQEGKEGTRKGRRGKAALFGKRERRMKFGLRTPSVRKMIAAEVSPERYARQSLGIKVPRGWGWLTNPKKAALQPGVPPDHIQLVGPVQVAPERN